MYRTLYGTVSETTRKRYVREVVRGLGRVNFILYLDNVMRPRRNVYGILLIRYLNRAEHGTRDFLTRHITYTLPQTTRKRIIRTTRFVRDYNNKKKK